MITNKSQILTPLNWAGSEISMAFSPNGRLIAIRRLFPDDGENVLVFDYLGNKVWATHAFYGHERGIAFWPDNEHIIIGASEGIQQHPIFNDSFKVIFENTSASGIGVHIIGVAGYGDTILAEKQKTIAIRENQEIPLPRIPKTEVYFSPNGQHIAFVWMLINRQYQLLSIDKVKGNLESNSYSFKYLDIGSNEKGDFICFLTDNEYVSIDDKGFHIWNTLSSQKTKTYEVENPSVASMVVGAYSLAKGLIATSSSVGTIRFWNVTDFRLIHEEKLASSYIIRRLQFSDDGKYLFLVGMEKSFEIKQISTWILS